MSRIVVKRYWPFYISIVVTGIVMVLLFLRPDSALGLTVDANAVKKFDGLPAGFKLLDPATGQPETVVIEAEVVLSGGEFTDITKATLAIAQTSGTAGFKDFGTGDNDGPAVTLPLPAAPNHTAISDEELTSQLPDNGGSDQGLLFVDVELVNASADAFGYGYGYRGLKGGGKVKFVIRYTPPSLAGDYSAVFRVYFQDTLRASSITEFVVLAPFSSSQVRSRTTVYPSLVSRI